MTTTVRPPSGLQQAIGVVLGRLAQDAEGFGVVLCVDPEISTRYLEQLQQIDRHAQSLRELAAIMRSSEPERAFDAVRLGDLRTELERAGAR
jgi:demethoxyubiquinone hydroxylase (CLK1/Coq7/Cat5 family)